MKFKSLLFGAALGAAAGMLFAPETGRRTRALIRDQAVKYSKDTQDFVGKKSRHLANKTRGYVHEAKGMVSRACCRVGEEMEEETLIQA